MIRVKFTGIGDLAYQTKQSSGADLIAQVDCFVPPNCTVKIPTGVFIVETYFPMTLLGEFQVRPRSGLSFKRINVAFGTVDADYRGEICVILSNNSNEEFKIERGITRVAQLVLSYVEQIPNIRVIEKERGVDGFGSSGGT